MPRPLCHVNVKKDLKLENKIWIYKYNILQTKNLTQKYMYVRNQNKCIQKHYRTDSKLYATRKYPP